ncbi:uncharacterized protein C8R40DRAFT_1066706 [Lentinula edodes]|uniref:uncharacterized protein n=1 Tax=Lentinula edodes TaxID=5353 RepID=UPI001E8EA116|nr:uncharacterized protein C8R40DRAFT_1066706 [Lentinula edodes]KAH7878963.1 hypothetical protein C8R40DRAFT_1066706 [Lentinula edodes]
MSDPTGPHSRSPSSGPPPARQQQRSQSRRRGRSQTARSLSASGDDSDASSASSLARRRRRGGGRKGGGLPGVEEIEDTGNQVANTAKNAVGQVGQVAGGGKKQDDDEGSGGDKPLKLRLDLNLDVAVELKARVHGDLTLSLLPYYEPTILRIFIIMLQA